MTPPPPASIPVTELSQVGEARRTAVRLAEAIGFDAETCGQIAIVASELATNLAVHAKAGRLFVQALVPAAGPCVELLSVDAGPGIADVARCLQDGYSTAGTAGNGLGAVRRLSSVFDLHSSPDLGTVVLSRIHQPAVSRASGRAASAYQWAAVSSAAPHELVIGDCWRIAERPGEIAVLVADGLGHGPQAAEAADRAAAVIDAAPFDDPATLLERAHRALTGSRGAAAAMARVDASGVRYAGVGNISASLLDGDRSRGLPSQNGTLGVQARRVQQLDYEWPGMLVMHSDGLSNRWSLSKYPGLPIRHPAVVAGVLWRDCGRGRDDATIVVVGRANGVDV